MKKIIKYVIIDILRNKIMLAYTVFLLLISLTIFSLEDNSAKGLLSLLNIIFNYCAVGKPFIFGHLCVQQFGVFRTAG